MKCTVCRKRFSLRKENVYLVQEESVIFDKYRDAIDCPKCGCQNILATRKKPVHGRYIPSAEIQEYARRLGIEADGRPLEWYISQIHEAEKKRSVKL